MTPSTPPRQTLKDAIDRVGSPSGEETNDYRIASPIGPAFLARSRSGFPALLIPLTSAPAGAGRRGGGFVLTPATRVAFEYGDRRWEQAAAVFECTEDQVVDAFLVLVADLTRKLMETQRPISWQLVVSWVEEWQTLLARKAPLTPEQQLGLWGELWIVSRARNPDLLVAAWRGPDLEATDFFLDGIGLEVKASRQAHTHYVSQRQMDRPVGSSRSYLLSIWAGVDPMGGESLRELLEDLLSRVADPPTLLKKVAGIGYNPIDCDQYSTKLLPLEMPRWYHHEDVPQIRAMDSGISHVRYVATLNPDRSIAGDATHDLWAHFCGSEPVTHHS